MKILYINSFYPPNVGGGAELSVQLIAEQMLRLGHEVVVLATKALGSMEMEDINGVKVYRAAIKNNYWPLTENRPGKISRLLWHIKDVYNTPMRHIVQEVLSAEHPDIVSCHNMSCWSVSIWKQIKKNNVPIVQVLHDLYLLCPNSNMFKNEQTCKQQCPLCATLRLPHKKESKYVDGVIGISSYILNKLLSFGFFPNSRTNKVIYNIRTVPQREINTTCTNELTFGFLGTITEAKGIELLINTFKEIKDKHIKLLIGGKGQIEYMGKIQNMVVTDPRIQLLGFVNSQEFYAKIDILVIPSQWEEPLGMVAVEACANNVPIIASETGGLKEIVKNNINGYTFRNGDRQSLKEKMTQIIENKDLIYILKENARTSVNTFLDENRIAMEYNEVYTQIINDWQCS